MDPGGGHEATMPMQANGMRSNTKELRRNSDQNQPLLLKKNNIAPPIASIITMAAG